MPPSDKTALESVIEVDHERLRLEQEAEELSHSNDTGESFSVCEDVQTQGSVFSLWEQIDSVVKQIQCWALACVRLNIMQGRVIVNYNFSYESKRGYTNSVHGESDKRKL